MTSIFNYDSDTIRHDTTYRFKKKKKTVYTQMPENELVNKMCYDLIVGRMPYIF